MTIKVIVRKINTLIDHPHKIELIKHKLVLQKIKITKRKEKLIQQYHEKKGIDFFGKLDSEGLKLDPSRSNGYEASNREALRTVLKHLDIKNDSVVDFGCGKGYALHLMSKFNFDHLCGIEISPNLYNIAKTNFERLKSKNVELYLMDAADFIELNPYTVFYFFNPFPEIVLRQVIQNIIESIRNNPRKVTIIYTLPMYDEMIMSTKHFRKAAEHHFENKYLNTIVYSNQI